ncbi:hypothetical protein KP509_33G021700 [Ceratopteris richardii]|uniref:Uncharacterized protein n=1 Tax=Ceratopteris richardii TaxID=49495 RepID=A0A8T2QND5_CERRI|nr:hypothetical protein KP509_33G021700 [Ceratopteris richardii]
MRPSSSRRHAGGHAMAGDGSRSTSKHANKRPQRGLGVAELERIRLQEEQLQQQQQQLLHHQASVHLQQLQHDAHRYHHQYPHHRHPLACSPFSSVHPELLLCSPGPLVLAVPHVDPYRTALSPRVQLRSPDAAAPAVVASVFHGVVQPNAAGILSATCSAAASLEDPQLGEGTRPDMIMRSPLPAFSSVAASSASFVPSDTHIIQPTSVPLTGSGHTQTLRLLQTLPVPMPAFSPCPPHLASDVAADPFFARLEKTQKKTRLLPVPLESSMTLPAAAPVPLSPAFTQNPSICSPLLMPFETFSSEQLRDKIGSDDDRIRSSHQREFSFFPLHPSISIESTCVDPIYTSDAMAKSSMLQFSGVCSRGLPSPSGVPVTQELEYVSISSAPLLNLTTPTSAFTDSIISEKMLLAFSPAQECELPSFQNQQALANDTQQKKISYSLDLNCTQDEHHAHFNTKDELSTRSSSSHEVIIFGTNQSSRLESHGI